MFPRSIWIRKEQKCFVYLTVLLLCVCLSSCGAVRELNVCRWCVFSSRPWCGALHCISSSRVSAPGRSVTLLRGQSLFVVQLNTFLYGVAWVYCVFLSADTENSSRVSWTQQGLHPAFILWRPRHLALPLLHRHVWIIPGKILFVVCVYCGSFTTEALD